MSRHVVRPKADQDLGDQAYYYGTVASPELGHRFLVAAHDTFALLATQPEMVWRSRVDPMIGIPAFADAVKPMEGSLAEVVPNLPPCYALVVFARLIPRSHRLPEQGR